MKTTIDIADDLFERAQRLAREQNTTFRALTEAGLRLVLAGKDRDPGQRLPKMVTFGKGGLTEAFSGWDWEQIQEEIYKGRGS